MIQDSCVDQDEPQQYQSKEKQQQHGERYPRSLKRSSSEESSQEETKRPHKKQQDEEPEECTPEQLKSYIQVHIKIL